MRYQIIHSFEGFLNTPQLDGMTILLGNNGEMRNLAEPEEIRERLIRLKTSGIDGLVVNVGGEGYLEDAGGWELFLKGLAEATDLGFDIWIYDEKGYPSGSAGGLVLRMNPSYEAAGVKRLTLLADGGRAEFRFKAEKIRILRCEASFRVFGDWGADCSPAVKEAVEPDLASDGSISFCGEGLSEVDVYFVDALYEGAHASRNYAEKRRYINLLDSQAVQAFVESTHECYRVRMPSGLFKNVSAFFTDEPSLMSSVVNEPDDKCGYPVPVRDPVDPEAPVLPCIPYSAELFGRLRSDYGIKPEEAVSGLFECGEEPSALKCAFWEAVSLTYEKAFSVQLSGICARLGKKLTGHILGEETPFGNMAFHANPFRVLKHFQLPGVDLLHSDVRKINVYSHKLPFSCAYLTGKNGIMSETSDFSETWTGACGPIGPDRMAEVLSMQFLLGVREFSYYYDFRVRKPDEYRMANDVIRRTSSHAGDFAYAPEVAVYCSFETIWSGYAPTALPLEKAIERQPFFLRQAQDEILRMCDGLFQNNVQFILFDCSSVAQVVSKGVRKVLLPRCAVISGELAVAAENDLELYGCRPAFIYSQGRLEKAGNLRIRPLEEYAPAPLPFGCEGLSVSAFEGDRYYCLNPGERERTVEFGRGASVYDPFEDAQCEIPRNGRMNILPGRTLFLRLR